MKYTELKKGDVVKFILGVLPYEQKGKFEYWEERDEKTVLVYIKLSSGALLDLVYDKNAEVEVEDE